MRNCMLAGVVIALTVARWLLPTEATAEGETLWIAGLWFLAGTALAVACWRSAGCRQRLDFADLAAGLFIGGHVLSGLVVLWTGGDRRAAINLIWEWLSLGVVWFGWRSLLSDIRLRQAWLPLMLVTAVTLSLWGLWQHYVWYPQMQREYGPLFEQYDELQRRGADVSAVQRKLTEAGIPTEGSSLELFRNRLLQSQEPFGPFALANTFGGVLAAWLVVGVCALLQNPCVMPTALRGHAKPAERDPRFTCPPKAVGMALPIAVVLAMIGFCLYLTNSRTAWAGAIVALSAGLVILLIRNLLSPKIGGRVFIAACVISVFAGASGLLWIAANEPAVPGPLKSLAYRAEYWIGTWRMLRTVPWLGAGLGQFRDKYLAFRLPESSEEIADPHNLLLDVWANGGLIALAGLLGLIGIVIGRLWIIARSEQRIANSQQELRAIRYSLFAGAVAFPLVIAGQWISTGFWDEHSDRLAIVAVVWIVLAWLLPRFLLADDSVWRYAGPLAALALTVHLLGAGGIGMPAVTQLWLLLILLGLPSDGAATSSPNPVQRLIPLALSIGCMGLAIGCYITGWQPNTTAKRLIADADDLLLRTQDADRAERLYQQAADADRFSPEPWQRLADLEASQVGRARSATEQHHLQTALQFEDEAIRRSPFRFFGYLRQAELLAEVARRTGRSEDWDASLAAYRAAEARHPTNVRLLTDFAFALAEAGRTDAARAMATRALSQDDLNHRRGHTDRYLPEADVQRLKGTRNG